MTYSVIACVAVLASLLLDLFIAKTSLIKRRALWVLSCLGCHQLMGLRGSQIVKCQFARNSAYFSMFFALIGLISPATSQAMGSGDPFSDAQTGLTYSVHKPWQTLLLPLNKFQLIICPNRKEQWLYAQYGASKKSIEIMETMAGVKCSNPGLSKQAPSITINNRPATVFIYCDPTTPATYKKCTTKDIARLGGFLLFTTKPTKTLKATEIQVQGTGGITYKQLLSVAKSLKVIGISTP